VLGVSVPSILESIAAAVVAGGAAGWLSSVFAAGPVVRRQDTARRRLDARRQLAETAGDYLTWLQSGRPQARGAQQGVFADGYADNQSRERLAHQVLKLLPNLDPRRQRRVRSMLTELIGTETIGLLTSGETGPLPELEPYEKLFGEVDRNEMVERHMLMDYHDGVGCKPETRHLCERDHYPQVMAEYGVLGLLWLTATSPHYQHFQGCYEDTTRLLTTLREERP
jgi:hypothetical protein